MSSWQLAYALKCGHRDVTNTFYIATPDPGATFAPHKRKCRTCGVKVHVVAPVLLPIPKKRVA